MPGEGESNPVLNPKWAELQTSALGITRKVNNMPKTKKEQENKALTAQTPSENKQGVAESEALDLRRPAGFHLNDKGELAINSTRWKRIEKVFLGSDVKSECPAFDNYSLDMVRLSQVVQASAHARGKGETPEAMNLASDGVAALAPRDGLEVLLCSQLVALHSQSMEFLRRGMLDDQTTDGVDRNVNRATKLLRAFATINECLRTYRSGGQQKMTVEHVTVQAGGQAVVGMVNQGGGECSEKTVNEPHAKRRGWLKNSNPPGDLSIAPRCGARTRKGLPCGSPAVRGRKRCRMHGGRSTGPRTAAGLSRSKRAHWKHGRYSAEARQEMAHFRELLRECKKWSGLLAR